MLVVVMSKRGSRAELAVADLAAKRLIQVAAIG